MSLRTVGYCDGRPIKVDEGPASVSSVSWWRGTIVTGETGADPGDANRQSSRRYRARHPDRLNEYQRAYRARIRAEVAAIREEGAA